MRVLVTGGSGFVGSRLKLYKPDWLYVSSSDYSLLDASEVSSMFKETKPDAVVHLAARVGGIKDNSENQVEFFEQNTLINMNVIRGAYDFKVPRVLSSLSTCAFPDHLKQYPFWEEDMFDGAPAETNFSYGYAKRMLHVLSLSYRKQHGMNYSTFCPSNIYGPHDHFDTDKSHFIPSLISKVSKTKDYGVVELWGTGKPLRQQLYVDDLCKIIPILLDKHNTGLPLIVAPDENLSIGHMAEILVSQLNKNIKIVYNNQLDGQFRKDGWNGRLKQMLEKDFEFTKFEDGILKTYNWYKDTK
mgnify:CR=1 FL=1